MQKVCFKCRRRKPIEQFYKHSQMGDGHLNKCKSCTKKDVKRRYHDPEARKRIIEYERQRFNDPARKEKIKLYQSRMRQQNRGKYRARQKVSNSIRYGKLHRKPCEVCSDQQSEAHHTDYRKPLQITWLCRKHHLEAEGKVAY